MGRGRRRRERWKKRGRENKYRPIALVFTFTSLGVPHVSSLPEER